MEHRPAVTRYRHNKNRFVISLTILALLGILAAAISIAVPLFTRQPERQQNIGTEGSEPETGWELMLVNRTNPLPEGYQVKTRALPNGLLFDKRAYKHLVDMIADGKSQGLSFVICSAYRSMDRQRELFDDQVADERANGLDHDRAVEVAATKVALPGTSEHNLGLAADIVALDYQKLDEGILNTPEYRWLRDNSYRYGFILRYPEGKSDITGIIFEPWHFRYVGKEAAEAITQSGLCLEEYLGKD